MELKRGMRDKLDKYVNLNDAIEIAMSVDGPSVYDFCCFGVDSANKLSDDRYMIFYNQISSPYDEIIYSSSDSFASFTIKLPSLPINIQKLVFTVSIDGNSTMENIDSYLLSLNQSGREALSLSLNRNDFGQEKAIVSIEIYKKDVWRINAVAMGFNGGLGDLLRAYGGEEMTSALQSPPSIPPKSAEDLYYQTDNCGDKKVSDNPEVIIEYNAENLSTKITVNGQPFDTSKINGKEIEDWVYPFMIRKVKWNGIFEELSAVIDSESFTIEFVGNEKWLEVLDEECPETVTIALKQEKTVEKDVSSISTVHIVYNKPISLGDTVYFKKTAKFCFHATTGESIQLSDVEYSSTWRVTMYDKSNQEIVYLTKTDNRRIEVKAKRCDVEIVSQPESAENLYHNGHGVKESDSEAVKWYTNEDYDDLFDDEDYDDEDFDDVDNIVSDMDLLYSSVTLIKPDCLKKMNDLFKKYSSAQINDYETLGKFFEEFNNLEIKIDYEEDDVPEDIVHDFISTLTTGLKYDNNNVVVGLLEWFNKYALDRIIGRNEKNFQNIMPYLKSMQPRLKALIKELNEDFNSNYDKIFEFFVETDRNSPKDSYIIPNALYYYFTWADNENNYELKEIEAKDKKTSTAATVGGAVAGGLLSLIPIVGIPLALGAGAVGGGLIADNTNNKYEESFRKYLFRVNSFFYHFVSIYILWLVSDSFLARIRSEAEEEAGIDAIDFDDSDDFFDEI